MGARPSRSPPADHASHRLDDRPLHPPHRGFHSPAGCAWGQAAGRCPHLAAVGSQSAVQSGFLVRGTQAPGHRLHTPARPGRIAPPRKDSTNLGWRNAGFRGFADYMQTPDFEKSLEQLIAMAKKERLAIMCAEAVPWRCHRSLIADALLVRGLRVEEISSLTRTQPHKLTLSPTYSGPKLPTLGCPSPSRKTQRNLADCHGDTESQRFLDQFSSVALWLTLFPSCSFHALRRIGARPGDVGGGAVG